jgi:hypothetical protein
MEVQDLVKDIVKYLVENQVILPVTITCMVAYLTFRKTDHAKQDENFIRLKDQYRELWSEMVSSDCLHKSVKEVSKKEHKQARLISFQLVEFFFMVWFLNYKKPSRYQKQWDHNLEHVFSYPLMGSTLEKHAKQFDPEYQEFIKSNFIKKSI